MKTLVLEQTSRKRWLRLLAWLTVVFLYQETRAQIANATCNEQEPLVNGTFTNISATGTTFGGCVPIVSFVDNEANVVNSTLTDAASIALSGIGCGGRIIVKDNDAADEYPAGTFAGFEVGTAGLIGASVGSSVTIYTYNNGVLKETHNAVTSLLGINSSLLMANGHAILGFVTTQPFDEVRIEYSSLLGALFSASVYNVIIQKFCAGPSLVCNTQTQMNSPTFPTIIDGDETGITGVACVGCSVTNAENVLTSSTTDYATISMAVSLGTTASLAVKDQLTDYTAGTFAGFNISNANLIGANLLSGITIKTYLDGVLKETSGSGTLLSLSSALLTGTGEQLVGFVTTQPFDEVKIEIQNLLGILSTTRVYNAVFMKYCAGPALTCTTNTNYVLPTYPASINGARTGISGAVCALCSVNNPLNVIDNSSTNYGEIVLTAGLISSGSISVKDGVTTHPAGTFAGFDIENSSLIGVNLLSAATISTYLNGVLKETTSGNLISLQLLSSSRQIVGFVTTQAFDEVRITVGNLVSLNIGNTKVYGLVLRGASAAGALPPAITPTTTANSCPTTTVNLRTLANTGTVPSGAKLVWSTSKTPASSSDTIADASAVGAGGKYYALYMDTATGCFGLTVDSVTVSITTCNVGGVAPGGASTSPRNWYKAEVGSLLTNTPTLATRALENAGTPTVGTANAEHNFYPFITGFSSTDYVRSKLVSTGADAYTPGAPIYNPKITYFVVGRMTGDGGSLVGIDNDWTYASEFGLKIVKNGTNAGKLNRYNFWTNGDKISALDATTVKGSNAIFGLAVRDDNAPSNTTAAGDTVVFVLNGQQEKVNQASALWTPHLAIGNDGFSGSEGTGSDEFEGDINEVMIFDSYLSQADRRRVSTYLALKYGVTLKDEAGAATNYVLSDGTTTIWDTGINAGFNNNIAGLVRDDNGLIDQRQAASSSSSMVAIANLAFANSNATNINQLSDKNAMMWGSDAGSAAFATTFTASAMSHRMTRIFKVQETGTVGNVEVAIARSAIGGCPTNVNLIVSTDATISGTDQILPMTSKMINGVEYFTVVTNLANAAYFTFGAFVGNPGGVGTSLTLWLDPASGTNTTTDNGAVSSWKDAALGVDFQQATSTLQPKYRTNNGLFNFNPSVNFNINNTIIDARLQGNYSTIAPWAGKNGTVYVIYNREETSTWTNFVDFGKTNTDSNNPQLGITAANKIGSWMDSGGGQDDSPFDPGIGETRLAGYDWTYNTAGAISYYLDGKKGSGGASQKIGLPTDEIGSYLNIGGDPQLGEYFHGEIAEVIGYQTRHDAVTRQRVMSYLALKYGLTLDPTDTEAIITEGDYVSADGTSVVWNYSTNTGYHNNVTGIGRDDLGCLNQKQSKSARDGVVTLGIGSTIAASNATNTNTFGTDKSYEIIGDNALVASYANAYAPNSYSPTTGFYRMSRIWKVQETGTVGTVTVSIPGSGNGVYLLVKNTNDFSTSSGVTEIQMTPDGNGNLTAQVNFTNGQFFTFGSELTAPGCVANGLAVWLKADNGTSTTTEGADVTAWQDASGNGRTHVAATGTTLSLGKPSYVVNSGFNFNPALNFSSAGQGDGLVTPAFASGDEAVHVFAVTRVDDNGWRSIYSFRRDITHPQWLSSVPSVYLIGNYSTTTNNGVLYGVTSHILNKTTADNQQIWWNGSKYTFTGNKTYSYSSNLAGNSRMYVGNDALYDGVNFTGSEVFGGDIMEVAIYKTGTPTTLGGPMTDTDIKKIESYLGLKYGITLAHEYYSGGGVKVWDNADATYHRNVAGIARDDCQALNQKQARSYTSADMTVAIDDSIATTNAANPGSFSNDKAFLMFGDNNGTGIATLTSNPCNPPIVDKFTNKSWKFVETGSVEAVKVSVDLSSAGFNASYPVFMQVASDASFSTIIASIPMVKNGSKYETSYDFNGTRYVRFLGNTTPPANVCSDDKVYRWNQPFWTWGTTNRTTTFADGQNINVRIQGNGIYLPTIHPYSLGWWEHIFIPRYDKLSDNNKIVTRIGMAKVASKVSFEVFDLDEFYGKDVVEVYGKLGATVVSPKITFPKYTALAKTGNKVSATTGVWDISQWGRFYVNFESPVDSVIIEYTRASSPFSFNFPTYQDIRIENLEIQCIPPAPKAPTADNVYIFKEVTTANPKVDEEFTYKFTIQNLAACDSVRTINFTDVLPSGLTWVDSSLATSLTLNSLNFTTSSLSFSADVPGGTSYLYVKAKGSNTGTFANQATFTVNRSSGASPVYKSDNPRVSGSQDPTPVTINANKPVANLQLTKSANKTTAGANEDIVYTYTIKNNGGASVTTNFQDNLPGNAGGGLTYTGVYTTVPGAPASIATSPLAGSSSVLIRGITVPAGGTVSFTLTANTGTFTGGNTATNIATVTPDSNYRQTTVSSNGVNVQIGSCAAGSTAPTLSATTKSNVCSAITANLTTITASNTPAGTGIKLTWHTATPATSANRVANPAAVPAGTYYAAFADTVSNCFAGAGSATTLVTVTTTLCTSTPPAQTPSAGSAQSGNAATELNPQGGTAPYAYTDDTNNCTAPSGATKLPAASNLTVNPTTGAYTYTAPNTAGTYYFCIKVCDSSSPTPKCATVTYTVTVGASAGAGTIDCAKTVIFPAPVAGTPSQHSLIVTVNVTTAGCFNPLTVTGSGMSVASGITQVCASTTGVQTLHIPVRYDGSALGTMNFTIGSLTTCSANLSTVSSKKVIADVWTLDNCSAVQVGPQLK